MEGIISVTYWAHSAVTPWPVKGAEMFPSLHQPLNSRAQTELGTLTYSTPVVMPAQTEINQRGFNIESGKGILNSIWQIISKEITEMDK